MSDETQPIEEVVEPAPGQEAEPSAPVEAQAEVELVQLVPDRLPVPIMSAPSFSDLAPVLDVSVELAVEIGRTTMTIRETLMIAPGSIIPLDKLAGEPVDLLVNGRRIARGEVIAIDEEFGLRVTEVVSPAERHLHAA